MTHDNYLRNYAVSFPFQSIAIFSIAFTVSSRFFHRPKDFATYARNTRRQ